MKPRMLAAALSVTMLTAFAAPKTAAAQLPVVVEFRVPKAPTVALIGDTVASLGYELHITNVTSRALTLRRVEVLNQRDGRVLLTVADSALLEDLTRREITIDLARESVGPEVARQERATLEAGLRAVAFMWVPISRSSPPEALHHRLTVQYSAPDTTLHVLEGATVYVTTDLAVIGPPLRGEWVAAGGPSNISGHRRSILTLGGTVALGQRYAIDYVKVDAEGRTYKADSPSGRLTNGDFYARGEEVLSVADGMVVQTNDSIPENEPGFNSFAVPITLTTLVGNNVVIDIGGGRFALYAHLLPGSLRVRVGDRVRRGQVLGLVGNTGGSTQPHLHFQLTDGSAPGTSTMGAEGIPYAHEQIDVLGQCKLASPMACTRHAAVTLSNAMPAYNQIVRFPVAAPPVDSSATRRR